MRGDTLPTEEALPDVGQVNGPASVSSVKAS
jgi:hypothetical protein